MKIGLIRERKQPADCRVALTPDQCRALMNQFTELKIYAESSPERAFSDAEFTTQGVEVLTDLSHCDYLLGVKEVPVDFLIPDKTYMFFSHTIKAQSYNRVMLKEIIRRNIRLIDYECLSWPNGGRILGFGHWAGIVGTYNALLVWGNKFKEFSLKPAWKCHDFDAIKKEITKIKIPPIKIVVTGQGRVAQGALQMLSLMGIKEIRPEAFVNYQSDEPVFVQLDYENLYKHKDGKPWDLHHFFENHAEYVCTFDVHLAYVDLLINGMYWENDMERLFSKNQAASPSFNIKVIADISCDVDGSVPITLKSTHIEDPVYSYNPINQCAEAPYKEGNIEIMAVSNLPAELPRDASVTFGEMLTKDIIPLLVFQPRHPIIEHATIAEKGHLTATYDYLSDFIAS